MGKNTKAQKKRKARMARTDDEIQAAQKRMRIQGKRDDELFVVDNEGGHGNAVARSKKQKSKDKKRHAPKLAAVDPSSNSSSSSTTSSALMPVGDVPIIAFEEAPTRAKAPAAAKNLRQLGQSKRVGPDRHLQGPQVVDGEAVFDLWGDDGKGAADAATPSLETQSFRTSTSEWHDDIYMKKKKSTRGNKLRSSTNSRLRAAEVVPSGASYNPEIKAYVNLVEKSVAVKLMEKQRKAQLEEQLYPDAPPSDPTLLASDDEEDSNTSHGRDENPEEAAEFKSTMEARRSVKTQKMTRAQRNAQARHKAKVRAAQANKKAKELNHQLSHLKEISKSVSIEEREKMENKARVEAWRKERELSEAPLKRGGKILHQQPGIEVVDMADLPGNIRGIKPFGNAVRDRMHNMMRRNVVEVGTRQRRKKPKVKMLERDRDWKLEVPDDSSDEEEDRLSAADWKAIRRP